MDNKTLIDNLSSRLNLPQDEIAAMQADLVGVIADALVDSDSVAIPSFGNFEPKKRLERISVHPVSGKRLLIPPKLVASFRPSAILKQSISRQK